MAAEAGIPAQLFADIAAANKGEGSRKQRKKTTGELLAAKGFDHVPAAGVLMQLGSMNGGINAGSPPISFQPKRAYQGDGSLPSSLHNSIGPAPDSHSSRKPPPLQPLHP